MCGITGLIDFKQHLGDDRLRETVRSMSATLEHRGPDDLNVWTDTAAGVALGHTRLAVVDLSTLGAQPMTSHGGRYVITFNGEIYNFRKLRKQLEHEGAEFRGHSDTEVLLVAIEQWTLERALENANGMFAFALWDRETRQLILARDRFGEKPLYYGWTNGFFVFASELKALRQVPQWNPSLNRDALALYFRHNYIPAPYSIYQGISKLLPGTTVTVSADANAPHASPVSYWQARDHVATPGPSNTEQSSTALVSALEGLLKEVLADQMLADVPLGAFLSGGIDSSTIVALMQSIATQPVKTFTIGFHEAGYNEADAAKQVARHLGTDHTELYVSPEQARAVIPRLPALYDEPFADSSQIPTFLISQLARQDVTVALSGDGGDEMFGGYSRYFLGAALWRYLRMLPRGLRQAVAGGMTHISPASWDGISNWVYRILPKHLRYASPGDRMHKLADVLSVATADQVYLQLVSHWKQPAELVLGSTEPASRINHSELPGSLTDLKEQMMFYDAVTYLPDDILTKVDRAAMGVSLETRIPFLDQRIFEFAWSLPLQFKIRGNQGKWLLRQLLNRYVPAELVDRPKMGFGIPIDSWLRGPLREWSEALLAEDRLRDDGYLNPEPIREKWREHLNGVRNWQYYLWDVLMFQAWMDAQAQ